VGSGGPEEADLRGLSDWSVDSFLGPAAFREPPCVSSHAGVLAMTLIGQGNDGDDRNDSSLTIGAEEGLVSQCR
jgi:hypothetical protein